MNVRFKGQSVDAVARHWKCYVTTFDIDLPEGNKLGEEPTQHFSFYL